MARRRRQPVLAAADWVALAVAASPVWLGLTVLGTSDWAGLLKATEEAGAAHPGNLRAWLELGSFLATMGLFVAALVGGFLTYRQVRDAKDARIASIYMEINKTYMSDPLRQARLAVLKLKRSFPAGYPGILADFMADTFERWKACDPASQEYMRFNHCIRIPLFWEDVGVLAGWEFVDRAVVMDFHGAALRDSYKNFHEYIRRLRVADIAEHAGENPPYVTKLYENALILPGRFSAGEPLTLPAPGLSLPSPTS